MQGPSGAASGLGGNASGAAGMLPDAIGSGGAVTQMSKLYKWKKINYKTFLPKHAPVVVYIVAKANTFERHH